MALIKHLFIYLFLLLVVGCQEKDAAKHPFLDSISTTTEVTVPKDSTELIPSLGLVYYKNEPFSGSTTIHHSNGTLVESVSYLSGIRNGYFRKWFADGSLSFECFNVNGRQEGETRSWWRNGNLRSTSYFEAGIAHGMQRQWFKSGAKFKEIQLNQGKEEGMQRSWRENGKLYNNYEVVNGRVFGLKKSKLCFQLDDENVVIYNR